MTGRSYLAIPGPSVVPDRVLNAMHRASPNIYEGEVVEMMDALMADLRRVAMTRQHAAIYIANGHGAWEAANTNLFSRGDKALLVATGTFGLGWANAAQQMASMSRSWIAGAPALSTRTAWRSDCAPIRPMTSRQ